MPPETLRPLWSYFAVLCLVAFSLNWIWEMAHMRAFAEMARLPWQQTLVPCTLASMGDAAFTLAVYGVGALAADQLRWGMSGRWNVYAAAALLGGACAAGYEWYSQATGRWSYTDRMPIVPLLAVGFWPLLQLTLLVPVAFWIATWWSRRRLGGADTLPFRERGSH